MKQTAVEWLVDELILEGFNVPKVFYDKAKEMEKEQFDNFVDFINERHFNSFRISNDEAEEYYNETFKQQEQ